MFESIKRIMLAAKGAKLWTKAIDRLVEKKYPEGKLLLIEYSNIDPGYVRNAEYFLFLSLIEYRLSNNKDALIAIKKARTLIEKNAKYNEDDKNYLFCYSDRLYVKLVNEDYRKNNFKPLGNYSEVILERVSESLKLNFPI